MAFSWTSILIVAMVTDRRFGRALSECSRNVFWWLGFTIYNLWCLQRLSRCLFLQVKSYESRTSVIRLVLKFPSTHVIIWAIHVVKRGKLLKNGWRRVSRCASWRFGGRRGEATWTENRGPHQQQVGEEGLYNLNHLYMNSTLPHTIYAHMCIHVCIYYKRTHTDWLRLGERRSIRVVPPMMPQMVLMPQLAVPRAVMH